MYLIWFVLHVIVQAMWMVEAQYVNEKSGCFVDVKPFLSVLKGFKNASRFRDETRSENSPKKLATPKRNSQLGSTRPKLYPLDPAGSSSSQHRPLGPLGFI